MQNSVHAVATRGCVQRGSRFNVLLVEKRAALRDDALLGCRLAEPLQQRDACRHVLRRDGGTASSASRAHQPTSSTCSAGYVGLGPSSSLCLRRASSLFRLRCTTGELQTKRKHNNYCVTTHRKIDVPETLASGERALSFVPSFVRRRCYCAGDLHFGG